LEAEQKKNQEKASEIYSLQTKISSRIFIHSFFLFSVLIKLN